MDSKDFQLRYARQLTITEIGKEGQEKIGAAKVLVIGCGALGSMVSMQLAGAGIGNIGIADFDTIDISNLQRQFFFSSSEAGDAKVEVLGNRIKALNPSTVVTIHAGMVTAKNAEEIFSIYDFIVDGTDNPDSKKNTGYFAKKCGKACCIGGVRDFSGQIMTFLPLDPRFEEYFGQVTSGEFLPCSIGGVIGPAAALCASAQAAETLKYILGIGEILTGRLFIFNLLDNTFKVFNL